MTGANHLLEYNSGSKSGQTKKLLVDCGMFQGSKVCEEQNHEPFRFDPKDIDFLFVTHGHLDHVGRIPKLVRDGFGGKIFSTEPTRDFAELMLDDSLGILSKEAERENKELIYKKEDIARTMSLWEAVEYDKEFYLGDIGVVFRDAGHILGSAMVEINLSAGARTKKIVFTGDLGNPPVPLLRPPYKITDANFLVIESTYGDREHEDINERKLKIERAIEDAVAKKGVLMIPAFSIERTQELLFEINDLVESGRIPKIPIFLDSPLAIRATKVYRKYEKYYNKKAKFIINSGDDVFKFPGLQFTLTTEESKKINDVLPPKVIMAGSGMSVGGRIIHHEKRYLSDPNSILLLVGFQAAGSLGRRLADGEKSVKILGEEISVRARIESVVGYSAHPDINGLYNFVENSVDSLEKVFVVQGEAKSALFFTQRVRDYLGVDAVAPKLGDSFKIAI